MRFSCLAWTLCLAATALPEGYAEEREARYRPSPEPRAEQFRVDDADLRRIGALDWHTSYAAAYRDAQEQRRQLFILFKDCRNPRICEAYIRDVLPSKTLESDLARVVRVIVPLDEREPTPAEGRAPRLLLEHPAFEHMYRRAGIAIVDLTDRDRPTYGQVVSAHPFSPGLHYTAEGTQIVLRLPPGTITQRTLTYAVRIHPEMPQSTVGRFHPFLSIQARKNSQLMADSYSVGHHQWDVRSSEISASTGLMPSEVAAVSYGASPLIQAATEIVHLWRTSPSHWGSVAAPQNYFGYDMVRAANGQWYGTGVFSN